MTGLLTSIAQLWKRFLEFHGDSCKSLDTVSHTALIIKFLMIFVRYYHWFQSYHSNRQQLLSMVPLQLFFQSILEATKDLYLSQHSSFILTMFTVFQLLSPLVNLYWNKPISSITSSAEKIWFSLRLA